MPRYDDGRPLQFNVVIPYHRFKLYNLFHIQSLNPGYSIFFSHCAIAFLPEVLETPATGVGL